MFVASVTLVSPYFWGLTGLTPILIGFSPRLDDIEDCHGCCGAESPTGEKSMASDGVLYGA